MYFGTLRYSYDDNTGKQVSKLENKQRITLSEHAVSTLLIDLDAFDSSDREYLTVKDIPSADVNKIFRSFCRDAESSVFLRLSVCFFSLFIIPTPLPSLPGFPAGAQRNSVLPWGEGMRRAQPADSRLPGSSREMEASVRPLLPDNLWT